MIALNKNSFRSSQPSIIQCTVKGSFYFWYIRMKSVMHSKKSINCNSSITLLVAIVLRYTMYCISSLLAKGEWFSYSEHLFYNKY